MGMFDTIIVEDALPATDEIKSYGLDKIKEYQTKDLLNCMDVYILKDNKIWLKKYEKEVWVEPTRDNKFGHIEREGEYLEEYKFHGEIYFYDYIQDNKSNFDFWVEYKAVVTNSVIERYELIKFEKTDNTERKATWDKLEKELYERRNKIYNKYFFDTKPIRWLSRIKYRVFIKLSEWCQKIAFY